MKHTIGEMKIDDNGDYQLLLFVPWSDKVTTSEPVMGDYRGAHIATLDHQNDNPCVSKSKALANAEHIKALWNGADKITTKQAVAYLKYGAEMYSTLKGLNDIKSYEGVRKLLTKLEADNG